ncbi:hypothetical protein BKA66DRAFT_570684 [Pyrenochaeta sp. MPI-SDFR-AT-0127]|nr:hypothetical protein BKA66DRAFT_570684 [Pyrenochaeta sp. MPI-SDFR-AT-0127]
MSTPLPGIDVVIINLSSTPHHQSMKRPPSPSIAEPIVRRGQSPSSRQADDDAKLPSQPAFFQLPRELRDQIYALLLTNEQYSFTDGNLHFTAHLGANACSYSWSRLPKWMLANKQMQHEVLDYFYREAVCTDVVRCSPTAKVRRSLLRGSGLKRFELGFCLDAKLGSELGASGVAEEMKIYLPDASTKWSVKICQDFFSEAGVDPKTITIRLSPPVFEFRESLFMHEGEPRILCDLQPLTRFGTHIEKVELVINEADIDTTWTGAQAIFHHDVIYSAIQQEVCKTAVQIVSDCNPAVPGYTLRDWLEPELYRDYKHWGTMHHWHLEVCSTPGKKSGEIKYRGMQTFRDSDGDCLHFERRIERENGLVEWDADGWGTKRIHRPKWVVEFANRAFI